MIKFLLHIPLLVGLSLLPALGWADFQAGLAAYERGDYETAVKEWRPLAHQGDADAQKLLGFMYSQGQGLPQNYVEAAKWIRLAAEQGDAGAQANLSRMYFEGLGVPHDFELALLWANLAAAQGNEMAIEIQKVLGERMSDEQLAEGQRLAEEWKPKGR